MSYQITTAEEIRALPEGAVVDTGLFKRTKTHASDEFDFVLQAEEVLEEGGGTVTVMGVGGPPQPKPQPTPQEQYEADHAQENYEQPLPADKLADIANSLAGEVQGQPDAMQAFKDAINKQVGAQMGAPSQFDDDSDDHPNHHHHDHGDEITEMCVLSVHGCGGSMGEALDSLVSYAIPSVSIANQLAEALNNLFQDPRIADYQFVAVVAEIRPFGALPLAPIATQPGTAAIDVGAIVQELIS